MSEGRADARRRAEERVAAFVDRLEQSGVHPEGPFGVADPLLAIADALLPFPADEIVIAAEPAFALPVLCSRDLLPRVA